MKKLAVIIIALSSILGITKTNAQVAVGVSVGIAPPELPVYAQPPCNNDGYLWSPGYWAYGTDGYYWVPGVWVDPPQVGFLWTPGYWGYGDGGYFWNGGYWGPTVGYYGGVCYGYGYGGTGFYGGRWQGGRFQYNTAAWHVNGGVIHNTYADRASINNTGTRSSFNGPGGVTRGPNATEQAAAKEDHRTLTAAQQSHHQSAIANKNQKASTNHSTPTTTARTKVGGDRYNSAGHSISTIHAANSSHTTATNHMSNPVAAHPSSVSQANAPRPQQQKQHTAMQSRPAPQQQQRQSPMQSRPSGGQGGGGQRPQEGGGGRH